MYKRKLVIVLGIILAVSLLSGCSKSKETKRRIKIEYMAPAGDVETVKNMEAVKKVFEEENPDYQLDLNFVFSWQGYRSKVLTSIAAGTAPDIIIFIQSMIYTLYDRGALYDLTDFVMNSPEFQEIRKDIYPPQIMDIVKMKGRYWAIPSSQNPLLLFYNKRLFKEAGIPFPSDDWTWDDFTKAIKKLTKRDEKGKVVQYGLIRTGGVTNLLPLNGASLINRDGTRVVLNSDKAYDILKWYYDLVFKYGCSPSTAKGVTGEQVGGLKAPQLFQMERGAMLIGGYYLTKEFLKNEDLDFDVAMVPLMNKKEGKKIVGAMYWMILKEGNNPQAALKLLPYLAGPVYQKEIAKGFTSMPVLSSIQNSPLFLKPGVRPEHSRIIIKALERPWFGERYVSKYLKRGVVNLDLAFSGTKDLREALDEDARVLQKNLDEAKKEGKLNFKNF